MSFPNLLKSAFLMFGATLLLYGNKEANIDHSPPRLLYKQASRAPSPQEYPTVKITEKAPEPVVEKPVIDLTKVPSRTRTVSNPLKSDGHPLTSSEEPQFTSDGQPLQ